MAWFSGEVLEDEVVRKGTEDLGGRDGVGTTVELVRLISFASLRH